MNISGEIHVHKTETPIAELPVLDEVGGDEKLKVYDNGVAKIVTVETLLAGVTTGQGLTEEIKAALLTIAQKVAYVDEHGQTYYDALYNALYPPATLLSISAVFNQGQNVVYDTDTLDSLKQYLTVTGRYDDGTTRGITEYTLSGTLTTGTSTITVSYSGKTTTFSVTVTHATVQYTITNNLTDVTNSNSATVINENAAYAATLTPSTNYKISTVSVSMGGTDITETAYSNGSVTIASVVGNIVITAVAVEDIPVSGPDAWYDGVDYAFREGATDGVYISKDQVLPYDGWSASDYMNCAGATSLTTSVHTSYGAWYDENKTYISEFSPKQVSGSESQTFSVPSNASYFRISWSNASSGSPYIIKDSWYITPNA